MKKRFSLHTLVIVLVIGMIVSALTSFGFAYRFVSNLSLNEMKKENMDMLEAVKYAYEQYYCGEIDKDELEQGLIAGYIYGTGDRYGQYMDAEEVAAFMQDSNGENVGIGVSVIYNEESSLLEVINVIPDSPAEEHGVAIGDLIYKVGEEYGKELGYYGSLDAMVGEEGSIANFTVLRGEKEIDFAIPRRAITQINASGHLHSDGVTGIIRIEEFDLATFDQFKAEIERLKTEGASRFVFDVRNNPGGDLESIVDILDYLLPKGPIIRIEYSNGETEQRSSDEEFLDMPMAVLINENTASAAELFASALKDYEAATLVGKTSYGKGCMQSIMPLIEGSALRITTAMYNPPYSENYDGIGVVPNIDCDMAKEVENISIYKLTDEQDTQLVRAIEYLNNNK